MSDGGDNMPVEGPIRRWRYRVGETRHLLAWVGLGLGLALALFYGVKWWIVAMNTVSTDEARVTASYATVSSEVSGKIVKFVAEEGDVMRQGDLLAEIDKQDYENALAEAEVELQRASAHYQELVLQFKGMAAVVNSEISRAEAGLEAASGLLKEKVRMHELAEHVGKSQVDQAKAGVKVAESNLVRAEVDLKKAGLDLERAKSLFDQQLIAAKELDDARTTYQSARASVDMRKAELQQLKAELRLSHVSKLNNFRDDATLAAARTVTARSDLRKADAELRLARARLAEVEASKARLDSEKALINKLKLKVQAQKRQLESTMIKSPVNGVVVRRTANVGDIVQRGQPLLKIIIRDSVVVRANVRETYLRYIGEGNQVDVYVDAYPNRVFTGKVRLIGDTTESEFALFKPGGPYSRLEQLIPVEIALNADNHNRDLRPGMNASVYIRRNSSLSAATKNSRPQSAGNAAP